ncbi:hypothetical protein E2320_008022 [Naja naja]|nr:hypothetical protein E2320_008022 [Naja naja]
MDENENAPTFGQHEYRAHLREDAPAGTSVCRVFATDPDLSVNWDVRYALSRRRGDSSVATYFEVGERSGLLLLHQPLDRELRENHQLAVEARDGSTQPEVVTACVAVEVLDVNDNPLVIQLRYLTEAGDRVSDRETREAYKRRLTAIDASVPPLFKHHAMALRVAVRNDQAPTLAQPHHRAPVSEAASPGAVVLRLRRRRAQLPQQPGSPDILGVQALDRHSWDIVFLDSEQGSVVKATDQDSGHFGYIEYFLYNGFHSNEKSEAFQIDVNSGCIYVSQGIDREENPSSYDFLVKAIDGAGTEISKLLATDKDSGIYGAVTYKLIPGYFSSLFKVSPSTALTNTDGSSVLLTISAQDGGGLWSDVDADVTVRIFQTTVAPAVFECSSYSFSITEDAPEGSSVRKVKARKALTRFLERLFILLMQKIKTSGLNGLIHYAIVSIQSSIFTIDPALGILYLVRDLSGHKQHDHVVVHIRAEDHGNPSLSSVLILGVLIDKPKRSPVLTFEKLLYQVEVSERSCLGARILQIRAWKPNPISATLTYSLEHNIDSVSFKIDPETGVVYLCNPLDYEHLQTHSFRAFVTSSMDKSVQNASTLIIISVIDENDNSPVFVHNVYFIEVAESVLPQGVIGTIKATDKDSGRNGQLSYFILSNENYFRINSNTGKIINWVALDYEQQVQHHLIALVTDHGVPQHNATISVYISVMDLNDNHPCFSQDLLHFKVLERQSAGTLVASIFAKDLDSGNNGIVLYSLSSERIHKIGSIAHHIIAQDPDQGIYLFSSNEDRGFLIDKATGVLTTAFALDREYQEYYNLRVVALDNGSPTLSATQNLTVIVLDVNDEAPTFTKTIYEASVWENRAPGVFVIKVEAIDKD